MSKAFASLRPGDKLHLPDGRYVASGKMTLRTPDGFVWNEWLLVPTAMDAGRAIEGRVHRWLVFEDEAGLTLWAPDDVPPGFNPDTALSGSSIEYDNRKYLIRERGELRVESIHGDVGKDASTNEKFEFADLSSGLNLMTIEWNARGVDLCTGRRIAGHDLVNWARNAGNDLMTRLQGPATGGLGLSPRQYASRRSAPDKDDEGDPWWSWVLGGALAFVLVALDECSGPDSDCRQQRNATTGQMETVCRDGVRNGSGRPFGGWGGK